MIVRTTATVLPPRELLGVVGTVLAGVVAAGVFVPAVVV
jgi:hypothetical protein